jgi:hypothetical protein
MPAMMKQQASPRARRATAGVFLATFSFAGLAPTAQAGIQFFDAFRTGDFQQTTASPGFAPGDAAFWFFTARVVQTTAGDIGTASVTYPGPGSPMALSANGNVFTAGGSFGTLADLDTAFPGGAYDYSIAGGTLGSDTASLTIPTTHLYAQSIPAYANFDAIQTAFDPSKPFTFQWNSLVANAAAGESLVFFSLRDDASSATVLASGALPGTTTSFGIPAASLVPGHAYTADVYFSSRDLNGGGFVNTSEPLGGVSGLVGDDYVTEVRFTTVPEPVAGGVAAAGLLAGFCLWRRVRR